MHKLLIAAALGTTAMVSAPLAADLTNLNVYQPQTIATYDSGFSWTGGYVGAHIGYGWGNVTPTVAGAPLDPAKPTYSSAGAAGGLMAGYNYDFGGFVLGAEADFSLSDIGYSDTVGAVTISHRVENFGSIRARAGVAVDRFLPYLTAGFAFGTGVTELTPPRGAALSNRQTHTGWTIGAGAEYAATDNVIVRAEYLYTDLGTRPYDLTPLAIIDTNVNFGTVRAGISFKF